MTTYTSSASSNGGIGFIGLLTIAFIVLKLTNVIAWSWFWVLSPIIFVTGFFLTLLLILGITFLLTSPRKRLR